jgi:hypothetical protein
MDEKTLTMMTVLAPPSTVMTAAQMLGTIQLSGLVRNPAAITALQFAASQACANTPTTVLGFVQAVQSLIKLHPDYTPADSAQLEAYAKQVSATGTDSPLTFSMLLGLLAKLPDASPARKKSGDAAKPETPAKRKPRKKAEKVV